MRYLTKIQTFLVQNIPTSFFLKVSERRVLGTVRRACKINPIFAKSITNASISNIETFKNQVPLSEKSSIFQSDLRELPIHLKNFDTVKTILVSSGSSGNFSFGLKSEKEINAVSKEADFALESYFSGKSKKTMIINCLPMGSRVYCSIDCSDVGPHPARAQAAIAMAKRLGYEQVFVVSLGHIFLKELLEYNHSQYEFTWKNVFFFTGGEFFPESARSYLLEILGDQDPKDKRPRIGNSGGVTELMLNSLFFESPDLIKIRQAMSRNPKLRELICGRETPYTPSLFVWNPLTSYLELIDGFITITNLDKNSLAPLVRYKLEDRGQFIEHDHLRESLRKVGLESLFPKEKLPLLLFWGRSLTGKEHIIQELIYSDRHTVKLVTGNFVLNGQELSIQLKRGVKTTSALDETISSFSNIIQSNLGISVETRFKEFEVFDHNMSMNYENKFSYMR
jgi:phenylacetate-CoA ligase